MGSCIYLGTGCPRNGCRLVIPSSVSFLAALASPTSCAAWAAALRSLLSLPLPTMESLQVRGLFWATCPQLSAAHHVSCFLGSLESWARHPGILGIPTSLSVGEGHNSLDPRSHAPLDPPPPTPSALTWSVGQEYTLPGPLTRNQLRPR